MVFHPLVICITNKMNSMSNNRYTPKLIAEGEDNLIFNIPLYQRLFEWGDAQINRLMDDLYQAYTKIPQGPYYIGMLTAMPQPHNKTLDLVDGQQRFTVMMLLGITFEWDKFTQSDKTPRLKFAARPEDERYMRDKLNIQDESDKKSKLVPNKKMEKGLEFIKLYLDKRFQLDADNRNAFGRYIYDNLTFFISELHKDYTMTELNTYFERMNTTGKALEQHEILKVTLLNKLEESKRESFTKLWNACSMMDRMLYRPTRYNHELSDEDADNNSYNRCRGKYDRAIKNILSPEWSNTVDTIVKEVFNETDDYDKTKSIGEIMQKEEPNPNKQIIKRRDVYAIPTFAEFLLQVLFITLGYADSITEVGATKDINGLKITDFFSVHKLNDTFNECLQYIKVDDLFRNLLLYRLILDYYMVRVSDNDEEPYPFKLYYDNNGRKKEIFQYETMLYAASSPMTYYYWMAPLLVWIGGQIKSENTLYINEDGILNTLEALDNRWHPNPCKNQPEEEDACKLRYGNIDRYYFWRIDYYLWKNRDTIFQDKENKLASNYIFRRNRSIEHIAPQHFGDDKTRFNWADLEQTAPQDFALKDSIGNLCMISSGQNSALKDSAFEEKRGHIESFLNDSINGYVESLKMLYVYSKYPTWTLGSIRLHEKESIEWLKKSYEDGLT